MVWYVVDGMDGCGKSTVANLIKDELESKGRKVLIIEHPNKNILIGKLERAFLEGNSKAHVMMSTIFYICDVLHSLIVVRGRKYKDYDDVIFVRYSMAVAYISDSLCQLAYDVITRILPAPDVKVLVDVEPETALSRIMSRGENLEIFETDDKLRIVRRRMLSISDGWAVIDNSGDLEYAKGQVCRVLDQV